MPAIKEASWVTGHQLDQPHGPSGNEPAAASVSPCKDYVASPDMVQSSDQPNYNGITSAPTIIPQAVCNWGDEPGISNTRTDPSLGNRQLEYNPAFQRDTAVSFNMPYTTRLNYNWLFNIEAATAERLGLKALHNGVPDAALSKSREVEDLRNTDVAPCLELPAKELPSLSEDSSILVCPTCHQNCGTKRELKFVTPSFAISVPELLRADV